MNREQQINLTEQFVKSKVAAFDSGHDWWHVLRVRNMASYINAREAGADPFILEIAALLHDTADAKFSGENCEEKYSDIRHFMSDSNMESIVDQIIEVISNVSYSNKNPSGNLKNPVLLIVQDADRLDAIGAIGIARAFNYGGFRNRPLHVPDDTDALVNMSTISHFYDKLLKLKNMMNTPTGRTIAQERHDFLENFLNQFYREWNFAI
jgi:uncharacterized protein